MVAPQASTTCLSTTRLALFLWSTSFPADSPAASPIRGWRLRATVTRKPSPCGHRADGTSDTSVLCPWWWMVTVHMGVILCLIFGLVMIGLMEMNEQYDVSIISQSNWQFWGQPDLAIGCIPPSAGFRLRMEPCHARQDGNFLAKFVFNGFDASNHATRRRFRDISYFKWARKQSTMDINGLEPHLLIANWDLGVSFVWMQGDPEGVTCSVDSVVVWGWTMLNPNWPENVHDSKVIFQSSWKQLGLGLRFVFETTN